jgi:hypothetical protein
MLHINGQPLLHQSSIHESSQPRSRSRQAKMCGRMEPASQHVQPNTHATKQPVHTAAASRILNNTVRDDAAASSKRVLNSRRSSYFIQLACRQPPPLPKSVQANTGMITPSSTLGESASDNKLVPHCQNTTSLLASRSTATTFLPELQLVDQ